MPGAAFERLRGILEAHPLIHLTDYYESVRKRKMDRMQTIAKTKDNSLRVPPVIYGWKEALGHLTFEATPSYAISYRILEDSIRGIGAEEKVSGFKSILDFGSGPGVTVLAAHNQPELKNLSEATMMDPSQSMREIADKLLRPEKDLAIPIQELMRDSAGLAVTWTPSLMDLTKGLNPEEFPQFDLVTAICSLSELPSTTSRAVAAAYLWRMVKPGGMLVVGERGDPGSNRVVIDTRELLLEKNSLRRSMSRVAHLDPFQDYHIKVVAPCTHSLSCPLAFETAEGERNNFKRGCFFTQVARRNVTLKGKTGQGLGRPTSSFGFSYFAMQKLEKKEEVKDRDDTKESWSRIIRHPMHRQVRNAIVLDVCSSDARLKRLVIKKRLTRAKIYKTAQKATWGGLWFDGEDETLAEDLRGRMEEEEDGE